MGPWSHFFKKKHGGRNSVGLTEFRPPLLFLKVWAKNDVKQRISPTFEVLKKKGA